MTKTKKKIRERVPYVVSKNHSIKPLRMQRELPATDEGRWPLGKYPFPVAIIHGSRTKNAKERVQQAREAGGIVINPTEAIKNASDKVLSKELFDLAGVPTTPWMLAADMVVSGKWSSSRMTLNYPIVAKKRSGMGGDGMALIKDVEELRAWRKTHKNEVLAKYFFEEAFNFGEERNWPVQDHNKWTREYRVGVSPLLNGRPLVYEMDVVDAEGNITGTESVSHRNGCVVALRKLMRTDASREGAFGRNLALGNSYFVRNFKTDYNFPKRNVIMDWEEGVQICQAAVGCLGLDYGAVDILWSSKTGEWCVVEVNTAPSMGDPSEGHAFTLNQWRQAFRNMIQVKRDLQGI
jgi:D-alanine-D-alanine ligase-like ATP-grasp enzyme